MDGIKIAQVDYFDDRFYRFDLSDETVKYIASVTTKLSIERKWALEQWRGMVGNQNADWKMYESSEKGKRLHWALQTFLTGGTILYNNWQSPIYSDSDIEELKKSGPVFILKNQNEMEQIFKIQKFYGIVKPKVLCTEQTVYDFEEGVAGTLDGAFHIEKGTYPVSGAKGLVIPESGTYIFDYKSGNSLDDSHWNQISAYTYCYEKMGLGDVKGGILIHSGASTKSSIPGLSIPLKTRSELNHDFDVYRLIANLWDERNPNMGPKISQFPSLITLNKGDK